MTDKDEEPRYAVPKDQWGEGPWLHEPDHVEFFAKRGNYPALLERNNQGCLCGYVGLVRGHRWYGATKGDLAWVRVHGGVTFANTIRESVQPVHFDTPVDTWWIGFDCMHSLDYPPAMVAMIAALQTGSERLWNPESYWTVDMVRAEVESLAEQLHAAVTATTPQGTEDP